MHAVGQGRPKGGDAVAYKGEVLTEVPAAPAELIDAQARQTWQTVCEILVARQVLKPAHFKDLINYCNSLAYVSQIDAALVSVNASPIDASYEELPKILQSCERMGKLRKVYIDTTLTIGSRFGFDALSEKRFAVTQEKPKSPENGFLSLDL